MRSPYMRWPVAARAVMPPGMCRTALPYRALLVLGSAALLAHGAISCSLLGAVADGLPAEVEARHRAHLERRMDQVVDLVSRMAEVVGTTGKD